VHDPKVDPSEPSVISRSADPGAPKISRLADEKISEPADAAAALDAYRRTGQQTAEEA
jgi:hypothetical protein